MSGMNFHRLTGLQVCILLNEKANLAPVFERVLSELGCEGLIDLLVAVDKQADSSDPLAYVTVDGVRRTRVGALLR